MSTSATQRMRTALAARRQEKAALRELLDRARITDVLRRYATGIDRVDLELVRSCYHPDAFDDHGDWKGDITAFLAIAPSFLGGFKVTMHMMGLPLIELEGDRADVETYAIAWHQRPGRRDGSLKDDVWGVRYLDRFERRDGQWRIAQRTMVRDWRRVDEASAKQAGSASG